MDNSTKTIIGAGAATTVIVAWEFYPQKNIYRLDPTTSPLAFLEHYHFGIGSLIVGRVVKKYRPYLYGFGGALIIAESLQSNAFGIGKPTFGASTVLGLALTTVLALTFV